MIGEAAARRMIGRLRTGALFIGGTWCEPQTGTTIAVIDPATETEIARIAAASPADVEKAVRAAHDRFCAGTWRRMRPLDRGRLLERLALLVEREADELAALETLDNGKPLWVSRNIDVQFTIDALRYFSGWSSKIAGDYAHLSPPVDDGGIYRAYTDRVPVGVVGGITPWNFPLGQAIQKIAPAIAFGCTVVLKPSELTSLTTLRLAQLIEEADFPPGAVNIVTGYGHDAGDALVRHPLVRKISFTGSTATGRKLLSAAAADLKRVTLELGGKSPTIILADADLDRAVQGAADAVFANSGQICTAGSRLFVHESTFDAVVRGVAERAEGLRLCSGFDPACQLGPLVSSAQKEKVAALVRAGLDDGATLVTGGEPAHDCGYFYKPTVLTHAPRTSRVACEEIFGPVVVATPFRDADEVPALANDTAYGLGASIWTRDIDAAHLMAEKIDAGTVWLNTHNVLDLAVPFGGMKQSGLGREFARDALHAYTEAKAVCMRLQS